MQNSLKILSFNIQHGMGMDRVVDLDRIAKIIKLEDPDLVCIQELDKNTIRTDKCDQLAILSNKTGLIYHYFGKAINYESGEYGNGVLSKFEFDLNKCETIPLEGKEKSKKFLLFVSFFF